MINEKRNNFNVIAYKDATYSVSFIAGFNGLSITSPVLADYAIIGMILKTGSTVALRNEVALLGFASSDNGNKLQFYSSTAASGTVTVRFYYAKWAYVNGI